MGNSSTMIYMYETVLRKPIILYETRKLNKKAKQHKEENQLCDILPTFHCLLLTMKAIVCQGNKKISGIYS